MSDAILNFDPNKHLPRWIRAIRWREWGKRLVEKQKNFCFLVYGPYLILYYFVENPSAHEILRLKPQTPEELEAIKRKWNGDMYLRDWDIGMYRQEVAPVYDMWERRRKYPEHYAGRYEGYKRYDSNLKFFNKDKPDY